MKSYTFLVCVLVLSRAATTSAFAPLSKSRLATLLVELGSADFEERESATRALNQLGERAYHPLRETMLETKDAEVRSRIEKLLETMQPGHKLPLKDLGPCPIQAVDFFPDGKRALVGEGTTIRIWDLVNRRELHRIKAHSYPGIHHARVSADGKTLASSNQDGTVAVSDTNTATVTSELLRKSAALMSVEFAPDGKHLMAGGWAGVFVIEVSTGKVVHEIHPPGNHLRRALLIRSLAFSPKGERFLVGNNDGLVTLWDTKTGKLQREFRYGGNKSGPVMSLAFTPDGKSFVSCGHSDNCVRLFDIETGKVIRKFAGPKTGSVLCVALTPDGKRLVAGGIHSGVFVWDVSTAKLVYTFEGHRAPVDDVSISHNGKWVLSIGAEVWHWRLPR